MIDLQIYDYMWPKGIYYLSSMLNVVSDGMASGQPRAASRATPCCHHERRDRPKRRIRCHVVGLVYGFLWPQHFAQIGAADNRQNYRAPLANLLGAVPGTDEN